MSHLLNYITSPVSPCNEKKKTSEVLKTSEVSITERNGQFFEKTWFLNYFYRYWNKKKKPLRFLKPQRFQFNENVGNEKTRLGKFKVCDFGESRNPIFSKNRISSFGRCDARYCKKLSKWWNNSSPSILFISSSARSTKN